MKNPITISVNLGITDTNEKYYSDYPNEPIGKPNPYWCCSYCGVSDPEINGRIEDHRKWCQYRIQKEKEKEL